MIEIKNTRQSIEIKGDTNPTLNITTTTAKTVALKTTGPRGPQGPSGPKGEKGEPGEFNPDPIYNKIDELENQLADLNDAPDFAAIFRNGLI